MTLRFLTFLRHDIRNILRDPALLVICLVPAIMLALLRWGYPVLYQFWNPIADYKTLLLTLLCLAASIMPGLALAFVMLDEKDNQLWQPLSITPVSFGTIVMLRIITIALFALITTLILLTGSGMWHHPWPYLLGVAVISAVQAPLYAMVPAFFAKNKIEGVTTSKLLNLMIMLPVPAFIFSGQWTIIMRVIPSWWIYASFESAGKPAEFFWHITAGILIHIFILGLVVVLIRKKLSSNLLRQG